MGTFSNDPLKHATEVLILTVFATAEVKHCEEKNSNDISNVLVEPET